MWWYHDSWWRASVPCLKLSRLWGHIWFNIWLSSNTVGVSLPNYYFWILDSWYTWSLHDSEIKHLCICVQLKETIEPRPTQRWGALRQSSGCCIWLSDKRCFVWNWQRTTTEEQRVSTQLNSPLNFNSREGSSTKIGKGLSGTLAIYTTVVH